MAKVIPIMPPGSAATFRAMARERAREAVDCLLAGDREGWSSRRRDADLLDDRARQAQQIEDEHRRTAKALEGILELAERDSHV